MNKNLYKHCPSCGWVSGTRSGKEENLILCNGCGAGIEDIQSFSSPNGMTTKQNDQERKRLFRDVYTLSVSFQNDHPGPKTTAISVDKNARGSAKRAVASYDALFYPETKNED
jgi:transcription initiation factor TFIIIB Brf1 subunit/transcription initiation factor TFIIB